MGDKVYEKHALFAGTVIYYTHIIIIFFFFLYFSISHFVDVLYIIIIYVHIDDGIKYDDSYKLCTFGE